MSDWYEIDTFKMGRRQFRAYTQHDSDITPWEHTDDYRNGVVSDWVQREPEPHERVLSKDRDSRRLFDGKQYIKNAIADGCTPKQAAEQLERAFHSVKDWCEDRWHYVGVRVRQIDEDGEDIEPPQCVNESVWGIEDSDDAYIREVAREIADEIIGALEDEAKERRAEAKKRRAQSLRERIESGFWAARGMVTA